VGFDFLDGAVTDTKYTPQAGSSPETVYFYAAFVRLLDTGNEFITLLSGLGFAIIWNRVYNNNLIKESESCRLKALRRSSTPP
jgi:hypothetical protein